MSYLSCAPGETGPDNNQTHTIPAASPNSGARILGYTAPLVKTGPNSYG